MIFHIPFRDTTRVAYGRSDAGAASCVEIDVSAISLSWSSWVL